MLRVLMISGLVLTLCACGHGADDATPKGGTGKPTAPTKGALVALLRTLESSVAKGDLEAGMTCVVPFAGLKPSDLPKLLKTEGVTQASIDLAAAKGRFGLLKDVFPERADHWAKKAGVDVTQCYALNADPAELAVHWDGTSMRFIRIDDLQKLR